MANTLPFVGYNDFEFDVQRSVSCSESGGRLSNIIEYADPGLLVTASKRGLRYSDAEALVCINFTRTATRFLKLLFFLFFTKT